MERAYLQALSVVVGAELRYVALRFGGCWPRRFMGTVALLLAGIVALRILQMTGQLTVRIGKPAELGLVAVLAAVALFGVFRKQIQDAPAFLPAAKDS